MSIHFKEFPGLIWKNSMTPPGFDIDCNWTTRWHRHACTVPFSSCHGFCAELNPAQNPDIKIHDLAFMHVMAALLYRWKHSGVSALNQAQFAVYESVLKSWTWVYIFSWHFQDFWEILLYFPWFPGLEFDDLKFQLTWLTVGTAIEATVNGALEIFQTIFSFSDMPDKSLPDFKMIFLERGQNYMWALWETSKSKP